MIYTVKKIEEDVDFGCEERAEGAPVMAVVTLADPDGREHCFRMEDQMLYERGVDEGDRVYLDDRNLPVRVGEKKKLAVIFPGIGYHCDKPLLYYGRMLAKEYGWEECVNLNYSFPGENIRGNEKKMQEAFQALYAQAEQQLTDIDFSRYDDILFLSKSVGTAIASAYADIHGISCCHVLYTPLRESYRKAPESGIAFIGTEDPWSNVPEVVRISRETGIPIFQYEGADHSLETGDAFQSLHVLEDVMDKTKQFLLGVRKEKRC